jgi:hypothetical protein
VDADPANRAFSVNDGNFLAKFGGAYGAFLAGRAAADHDQVVLVRFHNALRKTLMMEEATINSQDHERLEHKHRHFQPIFSQDVNNRRLGFARPKLHTIPSGAIRLRRNLALDQVFLSSSKRTPFPRNTLRYLPWPFVQILMPPR